MASKCHSRYARQTLAWTELTAVFFLVPTQSPRHCQQRVSRHGSHRHRSTDRLEIVDPCALCLPNPGDNCQDP